MNSTCNRFIFSVLSHTNKQTDTHTLVHISDGTWEIERASKRTNKLEFIVPLSNDIHKLCSSSRYITLECKLKRTNADRHIRVSTNHATSITNSKRKKKRIMKNSHRISASMTKKKNIKWQKEKDHTSEWEILSHLSYFNSKSCCHASTHRDTHTHTFSHSTFRSNKSIWLINFLCDFYGSKFLFHLHWQKKNHSIKLNKRTDAKERFYYRFSITKWLAFRNNDCVNWSFRLVVVLPYFSLIINKFNQPIVLFSHRSAPTSSRCPFTSHYTSQ